ncbi:DNA-methyltransferase [Pseudomonas aeruginosa]|uniref:DNA-methyltransferase n=2 Tax=Pseudomonas aeruginosa TaxID=287 RepID=UPI0019120172|nr:site-specific DNA-methyltransferase [Pseudomonas aeruginosa]HBO3083395.1 site-specific DNA-methyltransferase [Pseudomonas aeruginosa]
MELPYRLHLGDCLQVLKTFPDNSFDSVVTDPPYGLSFMGKRWDYDVPSVEIWAECLRVLKPGGHLLAFAGTRTQHRMALRIEDAGFEIRDMIAWVYGSGFPKSLDVSKAIASRAVAAFIGPDGQSAWCEECGEAHATVDMEYAIYCAECAAREWQGWGTALKPALEPITVARKPLSGTVAANVLAHGAGALNIDGCRIAGTVEGPGTTPKSSVAGARGSMAGAMDRVDYDGSKGRWPANLIHDGSEEVVALFPESTSGAMKSGTQRAAQDGPGSVCYGTYGGNTTSRDIEASSGSAARFFYCAKASRKDRNEGCEHMERKPPHWSSGSQNPGSFQSDGTDKTSQNNHPTVKPTDLMAYLVRLVTPPGGKVLDPFTGSGSTGKAAVREGFEFVGIEREPPYLTIAEARIAHELERVTAAALETAEAEAQLDIFRDAKEQIA